MKLTVTIELNPVNILGELGVVQNTYDRNVYIDDKLVPPDLARIILIGLDVATEQYLWLVNSAMKYEKSLEQINL